MASTLSVDQRLELITRGIHSEDVHGIGAIRSALEDTNKIPKCLWGESSPCRLKGDGSLCIQHSHFTYRQT